MGNNFVCFKTEFSSFPLVCGNVVVIGSISHLKEYMHYTYMFSYKCEYMYRIEITYIQRSVCIYTHAHSIGLILPHIHLYIMKFIIKYRMI